MHDVWPALFVADESRAEEALEALRAGTVIAPLASGGHVRRGASFLLVLENGRVLGSGEVIKVTNDTHELAVWKQAEAPAKAPFLGGEALVRLKAILRHESRPPLQVYVLPNEGGRRRFGTQTSMARPRCSTSRRVKSFRLSRLHRRAWCLNLALRTGAKPDRGAPTRPDLARAPSTGPVTSFSGRTRGAAALPRIAL